MISPGDTRSLIRDLEAQGWQVEQTERNHYRAKPPNGEQIVHFSRLQEPSSWKNALSNLRRSGYIEDKGKHVGNGNRAPIPAHHVREQSLPTLPTTTRAAAVLAAPESSLEGMALDALFQTLRDAKELHALAIEETTRASADLAKAQRRVDECMRAEQGTAVELRKAKQAFDLAFGD